MRVIKIHRYRIGKRALDAALGVLRAGGVVAYPTETAYGLAVDPTDRAAVRRVYRMKGRASEKALPLICADRGMASRFVRMPTALVRLTARYWPGPLTVVAPLRTCWRGRVPTAKDGTVAVRVPSLAWSRALAKALGGPITSTSANRSGRAGCYSGRAVRKDFAVTSDAPDLVLDAGRLAERPPSTIVAVKRGKITVLRQGSVKI